MGTIEVLSLVLAGNICILFGWYNCEWARNSDDRRKREAKAREEEAARLAEQKRRRDMMTEKSQHEVAFGTASTLAAEMIPKLTPNESHDGLCDQFYMAVLTALRTHAKRPEAT